MALTTPLDVATVRADFPLLARTVHDRPIVYLDSAATSQKPTAVLDAMDTYYRTVNANVHRGVYFIAEQATNQLEAAREKVRAFINAPSTAEVIFTRNATEALNLVVQSWGRANLEAGDVVVLSHMEHHANIVPWHMLVAAMSNVLGTLNPVRTLTDAARAAGAISIIDGCQSVPHSTTDVQALGADFMAFSGHKMCGPTGVGVLWGREELLTAMPPFLGGGEMIRDVRLDGFTTNDLPWKFEAGTPAIAEIIGLGAAIDYLNAIGMTAIREHEHQLTQYTLRTLTERLGDRITIHGPADADERGGVFSFAFDGLHPHDISQVLDEQAVCVRAGHHCAKPLMKLMGVGATARASVYLYNTTADIDALADALERAGEFCAF